MSELTSKTQSKKTTLTPKSDTTPGKLNLKCPSPAEVTLSYGADADETTMTATAIDTIKEICSSACVSSVKITSTTRSIEDQTRIMYDMIKSKGTEYVKNLYGASGQKIVNTYELAKKNKLSAGDTKDAMAKKMEEIGPSNVSHHIVNSDGKLCVFDVAPSSVGNNAAKKRFVKAVKSHDRVKTFFEPPKDPAFHLEIIN